MLIMVLGHQMFNESGRDEGAKKQVRQLYVHISQVFLRTFLKTILLSYIGIFM